MPKVSVNRIQGIEESAESSDVAEMTLPTSEVNGIEMMLFVSSSLPPVRPVGADGLQLSSPHNVTAQFVDAEFKNCSTKLMDHETVSFQDIVTQRGHGDVKTDPTVPRSFPDTAHCSGPERRDPVNVLL